VLVLVGGEARVQLGYTKDLGDERDAEVLQPVLESALWVSRDDAEARVKLLAVDRLG